MRLTTKGRYAVTAMLDLAINQNTKPVTLHDIASNQEISLSYLEQLFARLRKSGLVKGTRGPGGGYRLAREPGEISIADIVTSGHFPILPSVGGLASNVISPSSLQIVVSLPPNGNGSEIRTNT